MPFIPAIIGAVVGAIGAVGAAIGAAVGIGGALGASLLTSLALTAGLSLVGKLLRPTSKPPPARGSVTQVSVDPNAPQPYAMGQGLVGGVVRMDWGYGPTIDEVPRAYRWIVSVHSGGGPIEELQPRFDQLPIDWAYYTTTGPWLGLDQQLGECPEATALAPALWGPVDGWTSASKLSGQAAVGWNFRFDRDGKVFAAGVPTIGAYGKWVKCYDPRLDSTRPGGSGAHRIDDETTFEWTENPALHAAQYAYGRYQNGKRTMGCGLPDDAINWANVAAWANVCEANGWNVFGVVYEPDDRWQNLKDIAAAGGGIPVVAGGMLSFHYAAPRVSVATIGEADIADGDMQVTAMRTWRDRINTIVPRYVSPDHSWELVAIDPVSVASYVSEDGEVKQQEWPFNLVKDPGQAAQLGHYVVADSRELEPIELPCKAWTRTLRPGDAVDLDLPQLGLDTQAVILRSDFDPGSMTVKLTLVGETPGKHAFALGQTGTPPATPSLGMTPEERDSVAAAVTVPVGYTRQMISGSSTDPAIGLLTATDAGSDVTISVANHNRVYADKTVAVASVPALTGQPYATTLYLYYDDPGREGGAVTLQATTDATVASVSDANPSRHGLGAIVTPAAAAADTTGNGPFDPSTIIPYIDWASLGLFY